MQAWPPMHVWEPCLLASECGRRSDCRLVYLTVESTLESFAFRSPSLRHPLSKHVSNWATVELFLQLNLLRIHQFSCCRRDSHLRPWLGFAHQDMSVRPICNETAKNVMSRPPMCSVLFCFISSCRYQLHFFPKGTLEVPTGTVLGVARQGGSLQRLGKRFEVDPLILLVVDKPKHFLVFCASVEGKADLKTLFFEKFSTKNAEMWENHESRALKIRSEWTFEEVWSLHLWSKSSPHAWKNSHRPANLFTANLFTLWFPLAFFDRIAHRKPEAIESAGQVRLSIQRPMPT